MDNYAQILTVAIPFFLILILLEWGIGYKRGITVLKSFDTLSSLSSGVSNVIKDVLGVGVVIVSYDWMVKYLAVGEVNSTILVYVMAFVGLDFAGYWGHRFEHEINLLWNRHIIHHSSEEFNLACALRQNISAFFGVFFFLLIPMAILGVPAKVVAVTAPIHLFAQFWYHTRLIEKMGFLENILVTPSHHRVHHAINDEYLDKNFSQIFIIWDKLFGTFQEELPSVSAVYGIKKQAKTWNPFIINYQHFWILITDAWHTNSWLDKLRIFYKPTGWRPKDRLENAPINYIIDPYAQVKYETEASLVMKIWVWCHFSVTAILTLYMFHNFGNYSLWIIGANATILMLNLFTNTSLMDRSILSIFTAVLSVFISVYMVIHFNGGWLGLEHPLGIVIAVFHVLSLLAIFYFLKYENIRAEAVEIRYHKA